MASHCTPDVIAGFQGCHSESKFYAHGVSLQSTATKYLRALLGLFSPNLIDQSSCRILTTHAKTRPILHDDWSIRLGENRPYQSSQTFDGYALLYSEV